MKRTISTIATVVLMVISLSSFATATIKPVETKNAKEIVLNYVEATALGATDYNNYLFTEDFSYENRANNNKYGKNDYIKFLAENKGKTFDCETTSKILDLTNKVAIAKNTLTFKNFTRVDYITLTNTAEGWKVSKIITSYL